MEDKAIVGGSPEQEKRTPFFMNLASGLLTILLGLVSELFVTLVFLWRIAREFTFAGFAGLRSGQIRSFLASVFPMLICFVLFALIAFALIMLNRRRWKVLLRIFSAALVIAAFTGIVVAYSTKNLDNGAFYTTDGYRSMIYLTGIGFLIAAAIVLSVSLCFEHEGILRKLLMFFIPLFAVMVVIFCVWTFAIKPKNGQKNIEETEQTGEPREASGPERIEQIVKEEESVDLNEDTGDIYINNEIIIIASEDATEENIRSLLSDWRAELDASMGDIGIYRVVFTEALTYEKLKSRIKSLNRSDYVEDAQLNLVAFPEGDDAEDDDFEEREPLFPKDDWNGAKWDQKVPRDENWGMEAIDAPGAWGYRDLLSEVRIGLIDSQPDTGHEDLKNEFVATDSLFVDYSKTSVSYNTYNIGSDSHGTHVAGIMAASWDNGKGVAGVMAGKGDIYHCAYYVEKDGRVSTEFATGFTYLTALKKLIDQDVQAINISQNTSRLIGFAASHGNSNAISYLKNQAKLTEQALLRIIRQREKDGKSDFVIVVAAGNSNNTYYYKDDGATYGYSTEPSFWQSVKGIFAEQGEKGGSLAKYNNFLNLMDEPEVKDRVIVVGAIEILHGPSTSKETAYGYTAYSNIGDRVDIVAPGSDVYSSVPGGYKNLSGTSMAAPHVTGVAGLIFAANPNLTGPEVKMIIKGSSLRNIYFTGGYAGLVNAHVAVVKALKTRDRSVRRVLKKSGGGLDLCLIIDTTGSMEDDIEDAKEKMQEILDGLAAKTKDYRVALIDYRDFAYRSGDDRDYPAQLRMDFTGDEATIRSSINALDLGNGGDERETVYSALMKAAGLEWRNDAQKIIIVLGDAAPLDPEPDTGYTYDTVIASLYNASIMIDYGNTDDRVLGAPEDSLISVYSIGTDASMAAADFFMDLSEATGGSYTGVDSADEVGQAIIDSIEQIEIAEPVIVKVKFGEALKDQKIDMYLDDDYQFSFTTDERGTAELENLSDERYEWKAAELFVSGKIKPDNERGSASVKTGKDYGFVKMNTLWTEKKTPIVLWSTFAILAIVALPPLATGLIFRLRRRKSAE